MHAHALDSVPSSWICQALLGEHRFGISQVHIWWALYSSKAISVGRTINDVKVKLNQCHDEQHCFAKKVVRTEMLATVSCIVDIREECLLNNYREEKNTMLNKLR